MMNFLRLMTMTKTVKLSDKVIRLNGPKIMTTYNVDGTLVDERYDIETENSRMRLYDSRGQMTIHEC